MDLTKLGKEYSRAAWGLRDCSNGRLPIIHAMQDLIRGHARIARVTDLELLTTLCLEMSRLLSKHDADEQGLARDVFKRLHGEGER